MTTEVGSIERRCLLLLELLLSLWRSRLLSLLAR